MDLYSLLVLLHVVGAGALFASLGIEVSALHRLRRAGTADEARSWLPAFRRPGGVLGEVAFGTLMLTGLGMAVVRGGLEAWMTAALAAIAAMMVLGRTVHDPRSNVLTAALEAEDPSTTWRPLARDPQLHLGVWIRVGLLVGVLGLMALEPSVLGSIVTLLAGGAVGVGVGVGVASRRRDADAAEEGPAAGPWVGSRSTDVG